MSMSDFYFYSNLRVILYHEFLCEIHVMIYLQEILLYY